jgi:polysaccharide biosynthesis/export protein
MKGFKLFVLLCITTMFFSCATNIDLANYTKYRTNIDSLTISALDPVIQKNDILSIDFSIAGTEDAQRLMELYSGKSRSSSGGLSSNGFLVSPSTGSITIPTIGEVQVAGKTKLEVVSILQKKLLQYIKLVPVVTIRILNFTVYIEGEVSSPGPISVQNEVITLQEAIAIARGTTPYAILSDVNIIRNDNGVRRITQLDLRGEEIYTTKKEFYYLKQGDYIQIKANKEKYVAANQSTARTISFATTGITLLFAMFQLFGR